MSPRRYDALVLLVGALVAISLAFALSGLTWRLLGHAGGTVAQAPVSLPPASTAARADLQAIIALAPFGVAVQAGALAAEPSALGLELRGIIRSSGATDSTALIAMQGQPVLPYQVGASVGGALVRAIEIDHVVLELNGRREALGFPDARAASAGGAPPGGGGVSASTLGFSVPAAPAPAGAVPAAPTPPLQSSVGIGGAASPSPVEVYRDRVTENPRAVLDGLGAAPGPGGYRVGADASAEMRRAGLQPGDVVEKVNGVQVGDVERDRQTFDQAVASGRARIEVLRSGRRLVLSFPLR